MTKNRLSRLFIITFSLIAVLSLSVSALEWDGSSGGGTDGARAADVIGYAVRRYPDDNCVGYRFSAVTKSGGNRVSKVIDVFRNDSFGMNAYTNDAKFTVKYNKARLIEYRYGSFSTGSGTNNCYTESQMDFVTSLPSPEGIKTWQSYNGNLDRVLARLGIGTVDDLKSGDKILVEPIYDVMIEQIYHAVTETEIAVYGSHFLGEDSDGGVSSHANTWGFISTPTNLLYPNLLYTPDGQGLWPGASELSSRAKFRTIICSGYGVGIAYTETRPSFTPSLTVKEARAYKGSKPSKEHHYGTSSGNAFAYYDCDKGYPACGDSLFFTVYFPKESENVRVKQSVWIDGVPAGTRTGYSDELELFDIVPSPATVSKDKSYYTVSGQVDMTDEKGNVILLGTRRDFHIPVRPTVYRDSVAAVNVLGEEQAVSGKNGTTGKIYACQPVQAAYSYSSENSWYSYNDFFAGTNKETHVSGASDSLIALSYPRRFSNTGGRIPAPDDGSAYMRFILNTEWTKDRDRTKESSVYRIPVVKADLELAGIRIVGPDGNYADPADLECGVLYRTQYVYKNNTDCKVFADGFGDSEEKLNGSGVYVLEPNGTVTVGGGTFTIPSPSSVEIWGGVFLSGAGIHNTDHESDGTNNEMILRCRAKVPLAIEAVKPNAPYREKTDVITSYWLKNSGPADRLPDERITVRISICKPDRTLYTKEEKTSLAVPAKDKNLIYFRWTVPAGLNGGKVTIAAELMQGGKVLDTVISAYDTVPFTIFTTPDTRYEKKAPSGFQIPSAPSERKDTASWWEYTYAGGAFTKNIYSVTFTQSAYSRFTPSNVPTAEKSGGSWDMKSGYGITVAGYAQVLNRTGYNAAEKTSFTQPQYCEALFPEYGYRSGQELSSTLEYNGTQWVFRKNGEYGRVHFTPLYFPDGGYTASVTYSDAWTPAGMITALVPGNVLNINGNAYDDWYVGRK